MDETALKTLIDAKLESGLGGGDGDISATRQVLMDRYLGELYGNEKEGQSKITTREIFETVEWAMPAIVRVFEAGDRVIEFSPEGPDDEQAAEQETDAVNWVYQKDNAGFVTTHNIIKSALLMPNSYVKIYRDEKEETCTDNYQNLSMEEVAMLIQEKPGETIEIIGQEQSETGWNIEIKRTYKRGKTRVLCIPEEEIIIDSNHSELNLDDCEFVCHEVEKTRSDLIALGYDSGKLDNVGNNSEYSTEERNRKTFSDEQDYDDDTHKALKKYMVQECYLLVDWDDDGIAERRRVVKIGGEIFENEAEDYMPIASACSILMPHKHTGYALSQSIIDLQEIKTFFMRQLVNNMARVNNPRTLVTKGANLSDVLNVHKTNGVIRIKAPGDVTTEPTTPVIGQVLPLLDLLDQQKEGRSGITRNSMGLDADILAKSTEGAFMGAIEKADQRIEFIIRLFAETVFKDMFLKIHHLLLTHGDSKYMKLSGQWVMVNPNEWKRRESMTCNVGLGMGNRKEKMMAAQIIIGEQDKLVGAGAMGVLVNEQGLYNAKRLLVESAGQRDVDKYFMNPQMAQPKAPPPPPPPDPNMVMIQANAQIEKEKRQVDMARLQLENAKMQQAERVNQAKFQIEQMNAQFKQAESARADQFQQIESQYKRQIQELTLQMNKEKVDNEAGAKALAAKIDQMEMQLKDAQSDAKLEMDKYKADLDAQTKIMLKQMDGKVPEQTQDLELIERVINQMNRPKRIVTDENGQPIGVETVE